MDRKEYMQRLEQLLQDLPREEQEEALQYYNDYFLDAGRDKEDSILRELGTPEEVAEKIKAGCSGEYAEYSEHGFGDTRFQNTREILWNKSEEKGEGRRKFGEVKKGNAWKIFAILLLVFLASPVILPVGIATVAIAASLLLAAAVVLLGLGISGVAVLVAGIAVVIAGIGIGVGNPATGILTAGIGGILVAVGILLSMGIFRLLLKILPPTIRRIVNVLNTPFRKAGER